MISPGGRAAHAEVAYGVRRTVWIGFSSLEYGLSPTEVNTDRALSHVQSPGRHITAIGVLSATTITVVALSGQVPATSRATTTLSPVADGYVQNNTPSTNYGISTQFVVGNSPVRRSVLKFTVRGLTQPITNATLRIRTMNGDTGSNNGGVFKSMTNTTWSETGMTWNNQPAIDGVTLGSLGSVTSNAWYEINVTSHQAPTTHPTPQPDRWSRRCTTTTPR